MSEQATEPVNDAYAEYLARKHKREEQEPQEKTFDLLGLSEDAMEFIDIVTENAVPQSPRTKAAQEEVLRALRNAVRDALRASETPPTESKYADSG